jgi:endonuclease/exonuclease/phosphatase family metal-dependent hydrolase
VLAADRIDLTIAPLEPRGALVVDLAAPSGPLRVLATHLGLVPRERRRQFARLCVHITRLDDGPLVVLGDFNEWRSGAPAIRALGRLLGSATFLAPTFPTPRALLALDRIWVRPFDRVESVGVHRSPLSSVASDHYPVVARLRG